MRKIDVVEKPKCVWYEDEDGNVYDIDDWHDPLWSIEKIKKDSGGKAVLDHFAKNINKYMS